MSPNTVTLVSGPNIARGGNRPGGRHRSDAVTPAPTSLANSPPADDAEKDSPYSPPKILSRDLVATRRHSKAIESTVKLLNHRVKGTEKFWSESGAEALLQLKADTLSDTTPLDLFWHHRSNRMTGCRPTKTAAA